MDDGNELHLISENYTFAQGNRKTVKDTKYFECKQKRIPDGISTSAGVRGEPFLQGMTLLYPQPHLINLIQ